MTQTRVDQPVSWSVGTLYKVLPGVAPFAGVSKSYLTNFNSEATQNGIFAPESGLEYEAGIKFSTPDNSVILTAAAFDIDRTNVFNENSTTGVVTFNAQYSKGCRCRPAIADHAAMESARQCDLADGETDAGAIGAYRGRPLAGRRSGADL